MSFQKRKLDVKEFHLLKKFKVSDDEKRSEVDYFSNFTQMEDFRINNDSCLSKNTRKSLDISSEAGVIEAEITIVNEGETIVMINPGTSSNDSENCCEKSVEVQNTSEDRNNQISEDQQTEENQSEIEIRKQSCETTINLHDKIEDIVVLESSNEYKDSSLESENSCVFSPVTTVKNKSINSKNHDMDSPENSKHNGKKKTKLIKSGSSTPFKVNKEIRRYEGSPWKLTPEQSIEHFRALNEQLMLLNQQGRDLGSTIHRPKNKANNSEADKEENESDHFDNLEVDWFEPDPIKSSTPAKKTKKKRKNALKKVCKSNKDLTEKNNVELDKILEENARRNNLTAINVKNILHHVITNEHVLAMLKNKIREEETEETELNESIFEPTLTRSKAKELMEKGSCPWPISPLKKSTNPSKNFIEEHFDEESSSDEDYKPDDEDDEEEEKDSADEESFLSSQNSDIASTPSTPCTPRDKVQEDSLKECQTVEDPVDNIAAESPKEVDYISFGSHLPPYAFKTEIKDQIKNVSQEESDLIALRTRSKLPLNDTPLTVIEASFVAPDITTDMYDYNCDDEDWNNFLTDFMKQDPDLNDTFDDEINDPEYNFLEEEDKPDKEDLRNDRAVRISKKELNELMSELFEMAEHELCEDEEEELSEISAVPSVIPITDKLPEVMSSEEVSEVKEAILDDKQPKEKLSGSMDKLPTMTVDERKQLDDHLRKHVQLLTQIYLLTCTAEEFKAEAETCKMFLNELESFGKRSGAGKHSAFNPINLEESLKIVNQTRPPPEKAPPSFYNKRATNLAELPCSIKKEIIGSKVFMYPELLPTVNVNLFSIKKKFFTEAEDNLLALGLQQFSTLHKYADLIQLYLMPIKTVKQILIRIKNLNATHCKIPDNPVAYFKRFKRTPEFPRDGLDFDSSWFKAPKDQSSSKCPQWVSLFLHEVNQSSPQIKTSSVELLPKKFISKVKEKLIFVSEPAITVQPVTNILTTNFTSESSPTKLPITMSSCTSQTQVISGTSLLTLSAPTSSPLTVFMTPSPDKNVMTTSSNATELTTSIFTLTSSPLSVITTPIKNSVTFSSENRSTSLLNSTCVSIPSNISSQPNASILTFTNTLLNTQHLQAPHVNSVVVAAAPSQAQPLIASTIGLNVLHRTPEKRVKFYPLLPNISPKFDPQISQLSPPRKRYSPMKRMPSRKVPLKTILPKGFIYVSPVKKAAAILNALERKRQGKPACRHLLPKTILTQDNIVNILNQDKEIEEFSDVKLEPTSPEMELLENSSPITINSPDGQDLGAGQNSNKAIGEVVDNDSQSDVDNDDINNATEDENLDANNNDNDDDLAQLMAASTTIRTAPKRSIVNRKKNKLQREIETTVTMLAPDLVAKDPLREDRDTAFAQAYLTKVKKVLKNNVVKYEDFLRTLHEFKQSPNPSVSQLYKSMCDILQDHSALLEDFAGFLLPEQAKECDLFMQNQAFSKARIFLRKLEVHLSKHPAHFQKILKIFIHWQSNPNSNVKDLQNNVKPLLRSHPHLQEEFSLLFPNEKPPESYMTDFEEISLEDSDQEICQDDDDYEVVEIPDNGDELYGTKKCICHCHVTSGNPKIQKRLRHCFSCGIRIINGHIYLLTAGKIPRPAQVVYLNGRPLNKVKINDESKENIDITASPFVSKEGNIMSPKKNKGNIDKNVSQKSDMLESSSDEIPSLLTIPSDLCSQEVSHDNNLDANIFSLLQNHSSNAQPCLSLENNNQLFDVPRNDPDTDFRSQFLKQSEPEIQKSNANGKIVDEQTDKEKQERIILRISLSAASSSESTNIANSDGSTSRLSESRNLDHEDGKERRDSKPLENSHNKNVPNETLSSVWTKDADREILHTCQLKGATDDVFQNIATKLGNKTASEVKARFQQLMALFSQQIHDNGEFEGDQVSASESDED